MAKSSKEQTPVEGFGYFYDRFVTWVENMSPAKRKSNLIVGIILTVLLAGVSSIPLVKADWYQWVQAFVGLPAGFILFGILVGIMKTTKVGEWNIMGFKARNSAAQRIKKLLVVIAILVIIFMLIGAYIPYGVGGTLMVAIALTIYNLLRRTPTEIALAKQGVIDPRDVKEEE